MRCFVGGIGMLAPGIDGWAEAVAVLAAQADYRERPLVPPAPEILPRAERRRAGLPIRLALLTSLEATTAAGEPATTLASVFGSSNGDPDVIHAILEVLAGQEKLVSPTHFHNSVHNAAAGYWSIATSSLASTVTVGCHDFTFAATMLQAAAEVASERRPVLTCVYDAPMPQPLAAVRPTGAPFAAALVLTPEERPNSKAELQLAYLPRAAKVQPSTAILRLDELCRDNPAAGALPLLELMARREPGRVESPYFEDSCVAIEVRPCRSN